MRAERLLKVAQAFSEDLKKTNLPGLFVSLRNAVQNQVNSPSAATQAQTAVARDAVIDAIKKSQFYNLTPSQRQDFEYLDLTDWVGERLEEQVTTIINNNGLIPSDALKEIAELSDSINADATSMASLIESLERFNISPEELDPGEFELSVTIPRVAFRNEVSGLGKELTKINYMFSVFSEVVTGSRENYQLNAISTTDPTVLMAALPGVAALVINSLEKIVSLYEKVLTVRKLYNELHTAAVPAKILSDVKAHLEKTVKDGIEEYSKEVEKKYLLKKDAGRRSELNQEVRQVLWQVAERIDLGYDFDVRGRDIDGDSDKESDKTQEVRQSLKIVNDKRLKLQHFEASGEPVLRISEENSTAATLESTTEAEQKSE